MINPFQDVDWSPDTQERRKFARSVVIGFPIIAALLAGKSWLTHGHFLHFALWLGVGGLAAGLFFLAVPRLSLPFYLAWYFAACCIGIVVSNLLLTGFYYVVVSPIGLVLRVFGHDPMGKRGAPSTYWKEAGEKPAPSSYLRQF